MLPNISWYHYLPLPLSSPFVALFEIVEKKMNVSYRGKIFFKLCRNSGFSPRSRLFTKQYLMFVFKF